MLSIEAAFTHRCWHLASTDTWTVFRWTRHTTATYSRALAVYGLPSTFKAPIAHIGPRIHADARDKMLDPTSDSDPKIVPEQTNPQVQNATVPSSDSESESDSESDMDRESVLPDLGKRKNARMDRELGKSLPALRAARLEEAVDKAEEVCAKLQFLPHTDYAVILRRLVTGGTGCQHQTAAC